MYNKEILSIRFLIHHYNLILKKKKKKNSQMHIDHQIKNRLSFWVDAEKILHET